MEDNTYERFARLIHTLSGIDLGNDKKPLLMGRVRSRMRSLGIQCFDDYFKHIRNDLSGREVIHLLDSITTNHTFFFREEFHFKIISDLVLDRIRNEQRKIRIWCAASSTGEEPYSIGMWLLNEFEKNNIHNVDLKILATDLSTNALRCARTGEYPQRRIESVPKNFQDKYFTKSGTGSDARYQVRSELRDLITYRRLNLSVFPYPMKNPFDLIICRNVMIYFDEILRKRLVSAFSSMLAPGGLLIVGLTETAMGMTDTMKFVHPSVYQKDALMSVAV